MRRRTILNYLLSLCVLPVSTQAAACADHLYLDTQNMGFLGRTAARMVGLAPPQRVFDVRHPSTAWATVGETSEIKVAYQRPFFAKEVRVELSGSKNILFSEDSLQLDDRTGAVSVRFQVTEAGYNTINLTVVGEHKGELVREHSRIYVRSKQASPPGDMKVTAR